MYEKAKEIILEELVEDSLYDLVRHKAVRAKPEFRGKHPLSGMCYTGAEALYHLLGGKEETKYAPAYVYLEDGKTHWFLCSTVDSAVLDPTSAQFTDLGQVVVYRGYTRSGFLTKQPSKRAQAVIDHVLERI